MEGKYFKTGGIWNSLFYQTLVVHYGILCAKQNPAIRTDWKSIALCYYVHNRKTWTSPYFRLSATKLCCGYY